MFPLLFTLIILWYFSFPSVAEMKDFVYLLDNCPHDWLFTQCAAVVSCLLFDYSSGSSFLAIWICGFLRLLKVHHGGAGTTAAGLKAAVIAFFITLRLLCISVIILSHMLPYCLVVPNNSYTILRRPTVLGRAGKCQRSRSRTNPCRPIYLGEIGCRHPVHARSWGIKNCYLFLVSNFRYLMFCRAQGPYCLDKR